MCGTIAIVAHVLTFTPFTVTATEPLWTFTKVSITNIILVTFSSIQTFGVLVTQTLYNMSIRVLIS